MTGYENTANTELDNSLASLLQLVEQNMKAIRYETENMYSSQINVDNEYPYHANTINSHEKLPTDIANWNDDPTYKNYWSVNPRDIANLQEGYEQEQNKQAAFQVNHVIDSDSEKRNTPKRIQSINHENGVVLRNDGPETYQNGVVLRNDDSKIKQNGVITRNGGLKIPQKNGVVASNDDLKKHQNVVVSRDAVLNGLLQKRIGGDTSFLGDPMNGNWSRKYAYDSIKKCARCFKDVFPTELARLAGKTWHTWCIKCKQCWLTLDNHDDHIKILQGDIYCNRCFKNMIINPTNQPLPYDENERNYTENRRYTRENVNKKFEQRYDKNYEYQYQNNDKNRTNEHGEASITESNDDTSSKILKGILKQNTTLPPATSQYLLSNKRFMHPLTQKYIEEIENKSIKYDDHEESVPAPENDHVSVNMKNDQYHPSKDENHGVNRAYESVLYSARDQWKEKYGVPEVKKIEKQSSFVDRDYRIPSYSEQEQEKIVNKIDLTDNSETEVFQQKSDIRSTKDKQDPNNNVETYIGENTTTVLQVKTNKESCHLDSIQKTRDLISSDEEGNENGIRQKNEKYVEIYNSVHPSNLKGSESSYSKLKNKRKKIVSFSGPSNINDNTLPRLIEFKVSSKNRFYISEVQKSRKKILTRTKVTKEKANKEQIESNQDKQTINNVTISKQKIEDEINKSYDIDDRKVEEFEIATSSVKGWEILKKYFKDGKLSRSYFDKNIDIDKKHINFDPLPVSPAVTQNNENFVDDFELDIQLLNTTKSSGPQAIMERNSQKYAKKTSKQESKSFFGKLFKDKKSSKEYAVTKETKKTKNKKIDNT